MLPSIVSAVCLGADVLVLLREAEVEQPDPGLGEHDVARLQVAVHDALPVRGVEGLGDLQRDGQGLGDRHGPALELTDRTVPQSGQRRMAPGLGARSPSSRWYDDSVFETLDKGRNRELFGLTPRGPWT